jgi:hypothetical protein
MHPLLSFFLFVGVLGRPYPPVWTYNYGIRPAEPQLWQDTTAQPRGALKPGRGATPRQNAGA